MKYRTDIDLQNMPSFGGNTKSTILNNNNNNKTAMTGKHDEKRYTFYKYAGYATHKYLFGGGQAVLTMANQPVILFMMSTTAPSAPKSCKELPATELPPSR